MLVTEVGDNFEILVTDLRRRSILYKFTSNVVTNMTVAQFTFIETTGYYKYQFLEALS